MLAAFKDKLKEKRRVASTGPPPAAASRVGSSSKNPKKRAREGGNTARTYRVPGEMPAPPPSRAPANIGSPPTHEFNRPIPTAVAVPVAIVQESSLVVLGGDFYFTRTMNFNLPPALKILSGRSPRTIVDFLRQVHRVCQK